MEEENARSEELTRSYTSRLPEGGGRVAVGVRKQEAGGRGRVVVRARGVVCCRGSSCGPTTLSVRLQACTLREEVVTMLQRRNQARHVRRKGVYTGTAPAGEKRLTGLGSKTIDDAWIMRRARGTLYIPFPATRDSPRRVWTYPTDGPMHA